MANDPFLGLGYARARMQTVHEHWRALGLTTNSASLPTRTPTDIMPSTGSGAFFLETPIATRAELMFAGTGSLDQTFSARVWGWRLHRDALGSIMWVPRALIDLSGITLGSTMGVSGQDDFDNAVRFAYDISMIGDYTGGYKKLGKTTNTSIVAVSFDFNKYPYLEVDLTLGGVSTNVGALITFT